MNKEIGTRCLRSIQPHSCAASMSPKAFVFPHGPPYQHTIQMTCDLLEFRGTEPSVVADPSSNNRRHPFGQRRKRRMAFQMQAPASNRLSDRAQCTPADRRRERCEQTTVSIACRSRTERVTQKIKRHILRLTTTIRILAVHHPGLVRVQFQSYSTKPCTQVLAHLDSLSFGTAVKDTVIGIATKRHPRVMGCQPMVQRIVQEQVRQDRRQRATLRRIRDRITNVPAGSTT